MTKTTAPTAPTNRPRPFHVKHVPVMPVRGFWYRADSPAEAAKGDHSTCYACKVPAPLGAIYHHNTLTTDVDLCSICGPAAVFEAVAAAEAESRADAGRLRQPTPAPRGWEAV